MPKKQKSGLYRAKITIGYNTDGKALYKYVSGQTKRELEDAKQAAFTHYVDGTAEQRDMLFSDYAIAWYRTKKEPHLSESSCNGYLNYFNVHILPVFGNRMMRSIQSLELQTWLNKYAGKSKTLISMLKSIMQTVLSSAYAEGILPRDPSVALVRPKTGAVNERRAFTTEERETVLAAAERHKHGDFMLVLYYLGLRRGEALGLTWGDFDWKENTVEIQRDIDYAENSQGVVAGLKNKAAYRTIPVPDELRAALFAKRSMPQFFLFSQDKTTPLPYSSYQYWWASLMLEAGFAVRNEPPIDERRSTKGMPPVRKKPDIRRDIECEVTPHYFRHNYITMLFEAGVDPLIAMRLVGHSDYKTTASIYTHLNNQHLKNAAEEIQKAFSRK